MSTTDERISAVKSHAKENYGMGGWDILVETMSDDDIYQIVKFTHTPAGAVRKAEAHLASMASYRADIMGA